jgi:hypothetical protein
MALAYIDYQRMLTMARRAFSMVELQERKQRWLDCARTLESLLSYVSEVREMDTIQMDMSRTLTAELTTKWWLYKAYRCMYLAHFYSDSMKTAEAQGLLSRSREEIEFAQKSLQECAVEDSEVKEDRILMENLKWKLLSKQAVFRASRYVDSEQSPLRCPFSSEDLSKLHLIDIPPTFEPIPGKPILFDLAGGEIIAPSLSQFYEKGQGISGFFSSIWKRKP